jgi:LmbE family N-acetylglucosaminyl deacetylase
VKKILFAISLVLLPVCVFAQKPKSYTSSEILQQLQKLNTLGSVMYIAAHPDDENTRLIAYMANELKMETMYLSITRGDGGQNLIGPEIRELLGIIRTQELLAARRTDGGKQMFTRANDFGYSKHSDEAFTIWDREQVLADIVWAIRKFQPDIIITRFSTNPGETHGHHTGSAILAEEAFELAADPKAFPEQLELVSVWQAKRLFWNTYNWSSANSDYEGQPNVFSFDVGGFNPLLGKSYTEIAAESRTMHKSQGFGSTGTRGSAMDHLVQLKGPKAGKSVFDEIDLSWNRIDGGAEVGKWIKRAIDEFDIANPSKAVPYLIQARASLRTLETNSLWRERKREDLDEMIRACMGLYLEATANSYSAVPGEKVNIKVEGTNRSKFDAAMLAITINAGMPMTPISVILENNKPGNTDIDVTIPADYPISQPYWLQNEGSIGMFRVDNPELIGLPENYPALMVNLAVSIMNEAIVYNLPVSFKRNDPVDGESYRPFVVTPPIFTSISDKVLMFPGKEAKTVTVSVRAGKDKAQGQLKLEIGEGWSVEPSAHNYQLDVKGEQQSFEFKVIPPANPSDVQARAIAIQDGQTFDRGLTLIQYPHIPIQTLFPKSEARFVRIDLQKRGELVGYIAGAGDEIPSSLIQMGYQVEEINPATIQANGLEKYDAIVVGVRAYNTVDELRFAQSLLFKYVENGGTMIVQYNTNSRLVTNQLAPYNLKISRERVTVEEAEIRILDASHPIVNYPNKITQADFSGWVQERGLYFSNEWAAEFKPIFSSNDPGEEPLDGGLLVAKYGKGHYIYTGYAWFRQLPAGVPGAYRIFANMLSLGKNNQNP